MGEADGNWAACYFCSELIGESLKLKTWRYFLWRFVRSWAIKNGVSARLAVKVRSSHVTGEVGLEFQCFRYLISVRREIIINDVFLGNRRTHREITLQFVIFACGRKWVFYRNVRLETKVKWLQSTIKARICFSRFPGTWIGLQSAYNLQILILKSQHDIQIFFQHFFSLFLRKQLRFFNGVARFLVHEVFVVNIFLPTLPQIVTLLQVVQPKCVVAISQSQYSCWYFFLFWTNKLVCWPNSHFASKPCKILQNCYIASDFSKKD